MYVSSRGQQHGALTRQEQQKAKHIRTFMQYTYTITQARLLQQHNRNTHSYTHVHKHTQE